MIARLFCLFALLLLPILGQQIVPGRFIVELDSPPVIGRPDAAVRLGVISAEQDTLSAALLARHATVVARVNTVANALVVRARDASVLAGLPGVKRVEAVRRMRPQLYRALPTHQVPQAWDLIGGVENAGAGIKIGILDTGIESSHPGFQAPDMTVPSGYPLASLESDLALTNNKVIVARSFDGFSAAETIGHGTAVAMCAAGVRHESPNGTLSGVAPRAWIGAYRVLDRSSGNIYSDVVLQALDAATRDGMDVVNMSFGSVGAFGASNESVATTAVARMISAGVVVVNSAGNTPGAMTVDDTASSERVIAVGANVGSDTAVVPSVGPSYAAEASTNVVSQDPLSGPLVDLASLDSTGRACSALPEGSLIGAIPLILRGECYFSEKLANVAAAGAIAAIVYNRADATDPDPESLLLMDVSDNPTIPGAFIAYSNGARLAQMISSTEDIQVLLRFSGGTPSRLASFSSAGPSVELAIKPDLVATGTPIFTAAKRAFYDASSCKICDSSGYMTVQGTSFSAPLVAGAAAVLKAARPGLGVDDYRSLLINSAAPMYKSPGVLQPVVAAGTGALHLKNAVQSTLAVSPVSLSFQSGGGTVDASREFSLKNLGTTVTTFALSVESTDSAAPSLSAESLTLEPGASARVSLAWASGGLTPGAYQGFVRIVDTGSGSVARMAYWYAVTGAEASSLVILDNSLSDGHTPYAGEEIKVWVRVHDAAGLVLTEIVPDVVPVSGGGTVLAVRASSTYPNSWLLDLSTSRAPGLNVFRATVGGATLTFGIETY